MRHLYLKIYLAFLVIIAVVAILAPLGWWLFGSETEDPRIYDSIGKLAARALPPAHAPIRLQQQAISTLANDLGVRLSLYSHDGRHLVSSGKPLPLRVGNRSGWQFARGSGPLIILRLPDRRILVASHQKRRHPPFGSAVLLLALIVFSIGIYLLVRRLTGRLERLQLGVEKFGYGDLSARVPVEGKDEIALLAGQFNQTAERIEHLVTAQKNMLATASHELRTPLTRMRMAIDLLAGTTDHKLHEEMKQNIDELNRLIDEILLTGKLDANHGDKVINELDVLGLLAEEASHYNAIVNGEPSIIRGEEHLLRRLIRNLMENARRYAPETPIEATVASAGGHVELTICDRGPGVSESDRERIFEPFYRPLHVAEGSHGGVGLGLALVRQIARRHGGDVVCLPRQGGGSCFRVTLAMNNL